MKNLTGRLEKEELLHFNEGKQKVIHNYWSIYK